MRRYPEARGEERMCRGKEGLPRSLTIPTLPVLWFHSGCGGTVQFSWWDAVSPQRPSRRLVSSSHNCPSDDAPSPPGMKLWLLPSLVSGSPEHVGVLQTEQGLGTDGRRHRRSRWHWEFTGSRRQPDFHMNECPRGEPDGCRLVSTLLCSQPQSGLWPEPYGQSGHEAETQEEEGSRDCA